MCANGFLNASRSGDQSWCRASLKLVTPLRDAISVDVHAGPYSVRHCGRMPLHALTCADGRKPEADEFPAIDVTDNLTCVLGNAAGDCFVDAKTINDIYLALDGRRRTPPARTLDEAALLPFFRHCLDRVAELCLLDAARASALESWLPAPASEVNLIGQSAEDAYSADLRLVDDVGKAESARLPELVNWTCVRMVPWNLLAPLVGDEHATVSDATGTSKVSAELTLARTKGGDLIFAGGEVFVPTVDFGVPRLLAAHTLYHGKELSGGRT